MRITSQDEIDPIVADDSDDEVQLSPFSYAQHYVIFDNARISPAYKVEFHLNEKGPRMR